jgi:hypothetical protein
MESRDPLTKGIDVLFTLALFYALTQVVNINTWQGWLLWLGICMIAINEQISVRASYDVYNLFLYFLDIFSVLLYILGLKAAVNSSNSLYGYDPNYWIVIGVLWLSYVFWDIVMIPYTRDEMAKLNLERWKRRMFLFALVNFFSYGVMRVTENNLDVLYNRIINYVAQLVNYSFIHIILIIWNKDRFENLKLILGGRK